MVEMYYYMIKGGTVTNINQMAKRYRDKVTEYIATYGYTVAEDGTISKQKREDDSDE